MWIDRILEKLLNIGCDGGISIRKEVARVVIDGHYDGILRVVTHAHSDHIRGLRKSIATGCRIVSTPLTLEWLRLLGFKLPESQMLPVRIGGALSVGDISMGFEQASHIPGTIQVKADFKDGLRIVYTSDFKKPGTDTPVLNCDVLVIDAVYGDPAYVRPFDDCIEEILTDFIKGLLAQGPVYIYGYYGKIQEVMSILRSYGLDAPFILSHKQYMLARAAERFGVKLGDYVHASSREAEDIIRDGWFVYFTHFYNYRRINGLGSHVILSGWEFSKPYKRLGNRRWLVAFSDHADFNGLVEYVKQASPKVVIVNKPRSTHGEVFAEYVKRKLSIEAHALP